MQQPLPLPVQKAPKMDRALRTKREEIIWCLNNKKLVLPESEAAWFVKRARLESIEFHRAYIEFVYSAYKVADMFWVRRKGKT
ncbi:MAG: hypothetical protein GZ088_16005 [Acidipila sp.]|nr:hypothetical protein [Acidipila sp.]